jgi:hypothetical protein
MNHKIIFVVLLFLVLPPGLPFALGQVAIVSETEGVVGFFRLGPQGALADTRIPLEGATIVIGPDDVIWIEAVEILQINFTLNGEFNDNLRISSGITEELSSTLLAKPECCDRVNVFELDIHYMESVLQWGAGARNQSRLGVCIINEDGEEIQVSDDIDLDPDGPLEDEERDRRVRCGDLDGGFPRWTYKDEHQETFHATVIVIGDSNEFDFSTKSDINNGKFILTPNDRTKRYAMFHNVREPILMEGAFGSIEYFNVVHPDSTLQLNLQFSDSGPLANYLSFVLESPRHYGVSSDNEVTDLSFSRNGSVSKTTVMIDSKSNLIDIEIPRLYSMTKNGDSPLQYGLHWIHIYTRDRPERFNMYIPIFVMDKVGAWESPPYQMIDFTDSVSSTLTFGLKNEERSHLHPEKDRLPPNVVVAATDFINGITTRIVVKEIETPLAKIDIFNDENRQQITDFAIRFDQDVKTSLSSEGTMYILADSFDTKLQIEELSINGFKIQDYETLEIAKSEEDDAYHFQPITKIEFPQRAQFNVNMRVVFITLEDEIGKAVNDGTVTISNQYGEYSFPILEGHTLLLEDSDYTIKHLMDERETFDEIMYVGASETVELGVQTIVMSDYALTTLIFAESSIFLFFGLRIVNTRRSKNYNSDNQ